MEEVLEIFAKDGSYYKRSGVASVRCSDTELRWTSFRGIKDSMALCFIARYTHTVEVNK